MGDHSQAASEFSIATADIELKHRLVSRFASATSPQSTLPVFDSQISLVAECS